MKVIIGDKDKRADGNSSFVTPYVARDTHEVQHMMQFKFIYSIPLPPP